MAQPASQPTDFTQLLPATNAGEAYANLTDRKQAVAEGAFEKSGAVLRKPQEPIFFPSWTPRKPERFE